eukprot:TRINITY_DN9856_c0_g1_i1.p1 TRINITY_DN9856_c0_g1~~TRINITY_DN9856_c0_g1_i1.p1  ORF type:complete len:331 (-),score=59.07 TRINITY_DN9856_c0_g1_i1:286-1221(-)
MCIRDRYQRRVHGTNSRENINKSRQRQNLTRTQKYGDGINKSNVEVNDWDEMDLDEIDEILDQDLRKANKQRPKEYIVEKQTKIQASASSFPGIQVREYTLENISPNQGNTCRIQPCINKLDQRTSNMFLEQFNSQDMVEVWRPSEDSRTQTFGYHATIVSRSKSTSNSRDFASTNSYNKSKRPNQLQTKLNAYMPPKSPLRYMDETPKYHRYPQVDMPTTQRPATKSNFQPSKNPKYFSQYMANKNNFTVTANEGERIVVAQGKFTNDQDTLTSEFQTIISQKVHDNKNQAVPRSNINLVDLFQNFLNQL